jgi:hypothetical protein
MKGKTPTRNKRQSQKPARTLARKKRLCLKGDFCAICRASIRLSNAGVLKYTFFSKKFVVWYEKLFFVRIDRLGGGGQTRAPSG